MRTQSDFTVKSTPLKFEVGARTLIKIQRNLVRLPLGLADVQRGDTPILPPLDRSAHGYSITSLPVEMLEAVKLASGGMLPLVRQTYVRYYADLRIGFDAWWNGLSGNTRQSLKRKAKKIANECGGDLDVRRFSRAADIENFHDVARRISLRTYQEKLLGSGLPDTPEFIDSMKRKAAHGNVRAWLLYIAGEPAAYLYCPADGDVLTYAYVGHDPAFNDLSPGAVLQLSAMRDLFDEGKFAFFDFTEGEGQHKRQFATGGIACSDLLLLRPSLANRVTMVTLFGFNRVVGWLKFAVEKAGLGRFARKLRRG